MNRTEIRDLLENGSVKQITGFIKYYGKSAKASKIIIPFIETTENVSLLDLVKEIPFENLNTKIPTAIAENPHATEAILWYLYKHFKVTKPTILKRDGLSYEFYMKVLDNIKITSETFNDIGILLFSSKTPSVILEKLPIMFAEDLGLFIINLLSHPNLDKTYLINVYNGSIPQIAQKGEHFLNEVKEFIEKRFPEIDWKCMDITRKLDSYL